MSKRSSKNGWKNGAYQSMCRWTRQEIRELAKEMTKEEFKARAKEMARMMLEVTGRITSCRSKIMVVIIVSKKLMTMMEKTRQLMRMCETSKKNRNRSARTHAKSKKMTKLPILSAWIKKTLAYLQMLLRKYPRASLRT